MGKSELGIGEGCAGNLEQSRGPGSVELSVWVASCPNLSLPLRLGRWKSAPSSLDPQVPSHSHPRPSSPQLPVSQILQSKQKKSWMPSCPQGKQAVARRRPRLLLPGTWECERRHPDSVSDWDFFPASQSFSRTCRWLDPGRVQGDLFSIRHHFLSALSPRLLRGFKYLYTNGCHGSFCTPVLSPKLQRYIFYYLLITFMKMSKKHLKLNMFKLNHNVFLPLTSSFSVFFPLGSQATFHSLWSLPSHVWECSHSLVSIVLVFSH